MTAAPPMIGEKAPDFALSTPEGKTVRLSEVVSTGTVVLGKPTTGKRKRRKLSAEARKKMGDASRLPESERGAFLEKAFSQDPTISVETQKLLEAAAKENRPFQSGDLVAGRFRVKREIAEGGMGVVYEAIDEKLGVTRALKCAKLGCASHLPPEARNALRVTHPNVCRIFEIHSAETREGPIDFLSMELIEGGTLSSRIQTHGAFPEAEA